MLALARYRFDYAVTHPLSLPAFAGSTIRGVFGAALRATACMTKQPTCDGCMLLSSCPYASVFEPRPPLGVTHHLQNFSQIPRPYVIEPPHWGERTYEVGEQMHFHVVLAGKAVMQLPIIAWAMHRAFARGGVGKLRGAAELSRITMVTPSDEQVVLEGTQSEIAPHTTTITPPPVNQAQRAKLHFHTPLRLQMNGRRATSDEYTPHRLLTTLLRRITLMHEFHGSQPLNISIPELVAAAASLEHNKDLQWRDWTRYSGRQHQLIDLGGVVGTWELAGNLTPFIPYLHLGQWLHVGKEATFGLGKYTIEWLQ